jgi:methylisocitrate lyase
MTQGKVLRKILESPEILILPGVYDCLGAKIVESLGFKACLTTGFGISGSALGLPDYGFITATEMLSNVGNIALSIDIPLVADLDTGYGNPLNVIRTVTDAVRLNLGGIILEDQEWPKKCGHLETKRNLISSKEHQEKIRAAVYARGDSELVIVARTDARALLGLDEAIERGRLYFNAGADAIFIEAPRSVQELKDIASALPEVPLFVNIIEGGKTPNLSSKELESIGFKMAAYPLSGIFSATQAMLEAFQKLKGEETSAKIPEKIDFEEFQAIINVPKYKELEQKFLFSR